MGNFSKSTKSKIEAHISQTSDYQSDFADSCVKNQIFLFIQKLAIVHSEFLGVSKHMVTDMAIYTLVLFALSSRPGMDAR